MGAFICVLTGFYSGGKGIYPLNINVHEREIRGVLKGYGYNDMVAEQARKIF